MAFPIGWGDKRNEKVEKEEERKERERERGP